MKALFFEAHGGIEVLRYADLSDPSPGPGQALIRVRAVALNHLDIWVRRGWQGLRLPLPHIGGSDIAGELVSLGEGVVSQHAIGSRVIVCPGVNTADDEWTRRGEESVSPGYKIIGEQLPGGLAEYVCVPAQNLYRFPDDLTFERAAAPLLVSTTCWRMLLGRGRLTAGETVLVVGAGGGVNSLTIKMARAMGATVYTIASNEEKARRAGALGAHEVINNQIHPNWPLEIARLTKGRGVDLVVDNVGEKTFPLSLRAVRRGGRIVSVGNTSGHQVSFDNRLLFTKQISLIGSTMGSRQDFIEAQQFLWRNKIDPVIDRVAPLSEGISMIQYLEEGRQFGKVVLFP